MNADRALRSLARLPRPRLSAFFAAATAARAQLPAPRRMPTVLTMYWLAVAIAGGLLVTPSWSGVALVIAAITVIAFPAAVLRAALRLLHPLLAR